MKPFKKIFALVIAMVMVLGMALPVMADETSEHTITVTNADQNVTHTYEAYQIFKGKLDSTQTKLADVVWGDGVNGDALLTALKADTTYGQYFTNCKNAADVADALGKNPFTSTTGLDVAAGAIDDIAIIIEKNLDASAKTAFSGTGPYTATVTGDGYYFIKDTTTTLTGVNGSDTKSKFLLAVVKNTEITAKDTGFTPNKEITGGATNVKTGTAAVGDEVQFQVTIPVPNTVKYIDHFVFDMKDTLPTGMTFMQVDSIGTYASSAFKNLTAFDLNDEAQPTATLTANPAQNAVGYTVTVAPAGSDTYAAYTAPANAAAAVTTAGGQKIKVVFNEFKTFAETVVSGKNHIGEYLVIKYTAVVNDKADFTPTGNENEVYFDYANDPNHDYDGDEPGPNEPMGETPHDKTKTLLINIEIQKIADNDNTKVLAGAEFEISSEAYNVTLVSGEKFEASTYELKTGETEVAGTWYKLKDGSYTKDAPTTATSTSYDSTETTYKKVAFSRADVTAKESKKVTVITGEDGKIKLEGLKPGTYTIKETKAPTGYNLDETSHVIKVDWDGSVFALDTENSDKTASFTVDTATASITINNNSGATLPSTGGMGTTILYIIGAILLVGAAVLLITKRRMATK